MKKELKTVCVFVLGAILSFLFLFIIYVQKIANQQRLILNYSQEGNESASNDKYVAVSTIHGIIIFDYNGKMISKFLPSKYELEQPDQIALGQESFYLLYRADSIENKDLTAQIVQVGYDAELQGQFSEKNIQYISCESGNLYIIKSDNTDQYGSLQYVLGMYANYYVKEENFGEKLIKMESDKSGKCRIDDITFFQHSNLLFYSQPLIDDYSGSLEVAISYGEDLKQIMKGEREKGNCKLVFDTIKLDEDEVCQIQEYQDGIFIYGVCNILKGKTLDQVYGIRENEVLCSYFYRIHSSTNKIEVLSKQENCYGILTAQDYIVYYSDNNLCKKSIQSEQVEKWELEKGNLQIGVIGDIMKVKMSDDGNTDSILWKWNQEEFCQLWTY